MVSRWIHRANWDTIESVVLFIGTPRAGASMFGALLDAHPHMCVANEYNVLGCYVDATRRGPTRSDMLADILWSSRLQSRKGRAGYNGAGGEYKYEVPGQFQGRHKPPLNIVGAAKAGVTLLILHSQFDVLMRVQDALSVPIKFVHIVRNPFDLLSTLHKSVKRRGETRITTHIDSEFLNLLEDNAKALSWHKDCGCLIPMINETLGADSVLTVYQEDIVREPETYLHQTAEFLSLPQDDAWASDSAKIVWNNPHKSRDHLPWKHEAVEKVCKLISECGHLNRYYGEGNLTASLPGSIIS